jgi:hypothetical protein
MVRQSRYWMTLEYLERKQTTTLSQEGRLGGYSPSDMPETVQDRTGEDCNK